MLQAGADERQSGFQSCYDQASFLVAMEKTKQYACGGNLAWCKIGFTTSPGVPFNQNNIDKLKSFYFGGASAPQRFPGLVVVAVNHQQKKEGMMGERGAMEAVSPPELLHAFVFRLAELIDSKTADDVLEGWLQVMLTTMFMFEELPTQDSRSARADTLRENAVADYHGYAWTVLQKIWHFGLFRARKERELGSLSAARVASLYNEDFCFIKVAQLLPGQVSGNILVERFFYDDDEHDDKNLDDDDDDEMFCLQERSTAQDSEAVTESWVDQALTVWQRMLTCRQISSILEDMDCRYGHDAPLNGIVQYQLLISKTRTQDRGSRNHHGL